MAPRTPGLAPPHGIDLAPRVSLNALTEAQREQQESIAKWLKRIAEATTPEAFNMLAKDSKTADEPIRQLVRSAVAKGAADAGFVWKDTGFIAKPAEAAA